jgi:carbon-monoxide dehydrogenase large subunit
LADTNQSDFAGCLDEAHKVANWTGFERRRAEAATRANLRGVGLSTIHRSNRRRASFPRTRLRSRFDADGKIGVYTVSMSSGQGHEDDYLHPWVADTLGVPFTSVTLHECDPSRKI